MALRYITLCALVATGVKLAFTAMLAKQKVASNLQCQQALSNALCETLHEADQDSGNSLNVENKNINVDSKCGMQFNFHDCSVNITNNYK